jgi:predicted phosphodiesterase
MSTDHHQKIGIMADSHGHPQHIRRAARHLKQLGCSRIYHLGDICDTNRFDTADDCVDQVRNVGIVAVRGNNDHSLTVEARGRPDVRIRRDTLSFLEALPLSLSVGDARLVHSRPFIRRLGLSAMIGTVAKEEAEAYFKQNPTGLLFRGHSHVPELIHTHRKTIRFSPLAAGETIDLAAKRPCIVTCGALTSNFFLIWEPGKQRLTCGLLLMRNGLKRSRQDGCSRLSRNLWEQLMCIS